MTEEIIQEQMNILEEETKINIGSLFQPEVKEISTEVSILADGRTINISPEKLIKFEKFLLTLIRNREMGDEILVKAIQMQTVTLFGYVKNLRDCSENCDVQSMEESVKFIKQGIGFLELMLIECREKANDNES